MRPVQADIQLTLPASVDFEAGDAAYIDGASGEFAKAGTYYGIVAKKQKAGLGVTAIRIGIVDGLDVSGLSYGAPVFTSATAGEVADVTAAGQSQIGFVVPGYGSKPADKLVYIEGEV